MIGDYLTADAQNVLAVFFEFGFTETFDCKQF